MREFINESEPEIGVLYNSWLNKFGLPDTNWIEVAICETMRAAGVEVLINGENCSRPISDSEYC